MGEERDRMVQRERGKSIKDTSGNKTGLQPVSKTREQELGYANV